MVLAKAESYPETAFAPLFCPAHPNNAMSELPLSRSAKIKKEIVYYAYACFAKSWNGALVSVYALIGQAVGAGLDPAHFNIPDWRTLMYTFAVVFSIQVLGFLKDHPISEKLPESSPPFPTITKVEDSGKITTTPVGPSDSQPPKSSV